MFPQPAQNLFTSFPAATSGMTASTGLTGSTSLASADSGAVRGAGESGAAAAGQLLLPGEVLRLPAPPVLAAAAGDALAVRPDDIPALKGRDCDVLSVGSLEFPGELLLPSAAASVSESGPPVLVLPVPREPSIDVQHILQQKQQRQQQAALAARLEVCSGAGTGATSSTSSMLADEPQLNLSPAHSGTSPVVWPHLPLSATCVPPGAPPPPAPVAGLSMFALRPPQPAASGRPGSGTWHQPSPQTMDPFAPAPRRILTSQDGSQVPPPPPPSSAASLASAASGDLMLMRSSNSGTLSSPPPPPVQPLPASRLADAAATDRPRLPPWDSVHNAPEPPRQQTQAPVPAEPQQPAPSNSARASSGSLPSMGSGTASVSSPAKSRTERLAGRLHPRRVMGRVADVLNLHRCSPLSHALTLCPAKASSKAPAPCKDLCVL